MPLSLRASRIDFCFVRGILRKEGSKSTKNSSFPVASKVNIKVAKYRVPLLLDDPLCEHRTDQKGNETLHDPSRTHSAPGWIQLSSDLNGLYIHAHYQPDHSQTTSDITSDRVTLNAFFLRGYTLDVQILIINSINTTCDSHSL